MPKVVNHHEVVLNKVRPQLSEDLTTEELHLEIATSFLSTSDFSGKIVMVLGNEFLTTRYLDLPVGARRKAEQMIPFQIDDQLPFSSGQTHLMTILRKIDTNHSHAIVNVVEKEAFEAYHEYLTNRKILPAILTSEVAVIQNFVEKNEIKGPICLVDVGHGTTKAYFISGGRVVSNHTSFIAGRKVDEVIAATYQISPEDSVAYKHDNCFFLTEDQYDKVDENQSEFAKLMSKTFHPLVMDIRRWEVGFRVKHGLKVDRFLLIGGSSQIKNIENYFTEQLHIPFERIDPCLSLNDNEDLIDSGEKGVFSLSAMMAISDTNKVPLGNFLTGQYASDFSQSISPHGASFVFTRIAMTCIVAVVCLSLMKVLVIDKGSKQIKRVGNKAMNDRPANDRNLFRKYPDRLLTKLDREEDKISQSIRRIQAASRVNRIESLVDLSNKLKNNENVDLIKYKEDEEGMSAVFEAKNAKEYKAFLEFIRGMGYQIKSTDEAKRIIEIVKS